MESKIQMGISVYSASPVSFQWKLWTQAISTSCHLFFYLEALSEQIPGLPQWELQRAVSTGLLLDVVWWCYLPVFVCSFYLESSPQGNSMLYLGLSLLTAPAECIKRTSQSISARCSEYRTGHFAIFQWFWLWFSTYLINLFFKTETMEPGGMSRWFKSTYYSYRGLEFNSQDSMSGLTTTYNSRDSDTLF